IQGHDCTVRLNQGSAGTEAEQGPRVEVELEILLEVQAADREPAVLKETARRELEVVAPLRSLVVDLADDRIDRERRQVVAHQILDFRIDLQIELVVRSEEVESEVDIARRSLRGRGRDRR